MAGADTASPQQAPPKIRHREGGKGARSLGMHAAFRDDLAVEVLPLFEEPDVL